MHEVHLKKKLEGPTCSIKSSDVITCTNMSQVNPQGLHKSLLILAHDLGTKIQSHQRIINNYS